MRDQSVEETPFERIQPGDPGGVGKGGVSLSVRMSRAVVSWTDAATGAVSTGTGTVEP